MHLYLYLVHFTLAKTYQGSHSLLNEQILGKTHVPYRIDKTLDKSLYRENNPHLTRQFCKGFSVFFAGWHS